MSRIKLLQSAEIKLFNAPPAFSHDQRLYFFGMDKVLQEELDRLHHPCSKLGFVLQWGYFKSAGRFFEVTDFHQPDLKYLVKTFEFQLRPLDFEQHYNKQIAYHHRQRITELNGWKLFDEAVFRNHIERLVERQLMPRKILFETQSYLFRQRIEGPAYDKYLRIINEALLEVGKRISQSLEKQLSPHHRAVLDEFLSKKAVNQNADIVQYKTINQSSRPGNIETSLEQFNVLKNRLQQLEAPIKALNFSDAIINYHAYWTTISDSDKIEAHSDRYLLLLCFLIHQVRKRHDFFIDILLQGVKAAENATKRLQKGVYLAKGQKLSVVLF